MGERLGLAGWAKEQGGIASAAKTLGIHPSTFGAYVRLTRFPRPECLARMRAVLGDAVDLDRLATDYVQSKGKPRKRLKSLRTGLLVNRPDKLITIFEEFGIPNTLVNDDAEKYLARWRTTNVTVGEVRAALRVLVATEPKITSVEQIHETIAVARRLNLKELDK